MAEQSREGVGKASESADLIRALQMLKRIRKELRFPENMERKHCHALILTATATREHFRKIGDVDNARIADLVIVYLKLRERDGL